MAITQRMRILVEFGPDQPSNLYPFQEPAAFAAALTAALRAMTVENLYADAEFTGCKDGVTATLVVEKVNMGSGNPDRGTLHSEFEGVITLNGTA